MRSSRRVVIALAAFSLLNVASNVRASIIINFTEDTSSNQTTVLATGSLDTASLPAPVVHSDLVMFTYLYAGGLSVGLSPTPANFYQMPQPFVIPFPSGGFQFGSFSGPDIFGFDSNGQFDDQLYLPANYVSGTPIVAGGSFVGNFESLDIIPGTVVMDLPGNQTITLQFASVPEPAGGVLGLVGAACLALRRRQRLVG